MANDVLEQRLAAVEAELKAIRDRLDDRPAPSDWWNAPRPPMSEEDRKGWEAIAAYGRYYRVTGQDPPSGWKPGDPIPDVEPGE